ncbi:MAG: carbohydrate ABC transporter permease [Firmicutes bacterium]|nr:carbohydrate ABC transporter permease [Bacillota bacterium]
MTGKRKKHILFVANNLFLLGLGILVMLPFVFMLVASFTPTREIWQGGLGLRINPETVTLENFRALWTNRDGIYWRFFFNSVFVTTVNTILILIFTSMVGYGLAMYQFKGRNFLIILILCTMMIPGTILLLPLFRLLTTFRLMDSYVGLILPAMVPAFSSFFFRQFCIGLPKEYMEAARIDGSGEAAIFLRIYVPLMAPAFGAMAILQGMGIWNDFIWPMIVLRTTTSLTLAPGLMSSMTPYENSFDILFAGSVMSVIPIIILFLFNQRAFIGGLTVGGVKG